MTGQQLSTKIKNRNDNKILLIVIDGLGGLRHPDFGNKSELEYASLPNLDKFVRREETVLGIKGDNPIVSCQAKNESVIKLSS